MTFFRLERLLHPARAFSPAQKNIHSQLSVDMTKKYFNIWFSKYLHHPNHCQQGPALPNENSASQ
jgi:hypothetical protein